MISTAHARRIAATTLARHPAATQPPNGHTAAELSRLLQLLKAIKAGGIAVGHGRHPASIAAAQALIAAWTEGAGTVLGVIDWPADAASWLRPAQRLSACQPDAWVIADTPAGCAQLARRLAEQPAWTPARTFGFASVATADLIALAGPGTLTGMTGAAAAGDSWRIGKTPEVLVGLVRVGGGPEPQRVTGLRDEERLFGSDPPPVGGPRVGHGGGLSG